VCRKSASRPWHCGRDRVISRCHCQAKVQKKQTTYIEKGNKLFVYSPKTLFGRAALSAIFVGYAQLFTTLGPAGSQHTAAIGGLHSVAEAMFIFSLPVVGLKCSFHDDVYLYCFTFH
jgi:hypothetical protein